MVLVVTIIVVVVSPMSCLSSSSICRRPPSRYFIQSIHVPTLHLSEEGFLLFQSQSWIKTCKSPEDDYFIAKRRTSMLRSIRVGVNSCSISMKTRMKGDTSGKPPDTNLITSQYFFSQDTQERNRVLISSSKHLPDDGQEIPHPFGFSSSQRSQESSPFGSSRRLSGCQVIDIREDDGRWHTKLDENLSDVFVQLNFIQTPRGLFMS